MILALLAAWFGYKKASQTGRSGILWALICIGAFIGTQLLAGILIMSVAVLTGMVDIDAPANSGVETVINLVAIVASIIVVWFIFRYLDRIREEEPVAEVPPPPVFESKPGEQR